MWNIHVPRGRASFWSTPRVATFGKDYHWKSAIHGFSVTLRMLRVKSDKSDWLRIRNDFSAHAQKIPEVVIPEVVIPEVVIPEVVFLGADQQKERGL